jgi:hypothetical protein
MTLETYDPEKLDQLALRLLDVTGALRQMAAIARKHPEQKIVLQDHKPREWLARLEACPYDP